MNLAARRQARIDRCRKQAIELMKSPMGTEAYQGGYYTEMFDYLYRRIEKGDTPKGIPAKLLEDWKKK